VAGAIKRAAGREVESEAVAKAPIPVGEAIITSGGKTSFRAIIHAPTMERPAMRVTAENVGRATLAALKLAENQGFEKIAIPGMGTGVGGVDRKKAARMMVDTVKGFAGQHVKKVIFVDIDEEMVRAWQESI